MKKVLNIFGRPAEDRFEGNTTYVFREPSLKPTSKPAPQPAPRRAPPEAPRPEPEKSIDLPTDYAGVVAYFQKTVDERKSPFNSLVHSADRLKEFIPDEISRLKAAYALCGDRWSPEVLSLAINNHIADIDIAHQRAKSGKKAETDGRSVSLKEQAMRLREDNAGIQAEIEELQATLKRLQATQAANEEQITALDQKIQLLEASASSANFLDQVAENLKNDLMAKKVLLGLTAI